MIANTEQSTVRERPQAVIPKPLKLGEVATGPVVGIGRSAVYVDLGPQGTGIIYGREFLQEKEYLKHVGIGMPVTAKVVDLENEDGYIELSVKEAGRQMTWEKLRSMREQEETFPLKVAGANKGGLLGTVLGVQSFLPVSQLAPEHYPKVENGDASMILRELQEFVGQELEVQILDLNERDEKIILSERSKEKSKVKEILESYSVGGTIEGEVTGIVDFGAFVRFGKEGEEIEGLVHISEIDWQIIDDPGQFLSVGDRVQAKIIDISSGRVSLSLKALKEDPWKDLGERYKKGAIVRGSVTKFNPFGAFIEIEPKIQGLTHISEFGTRENMESQLILEKEYTFQILDMSPAEHRMSLRLIPEGSAPAPTLSEGEEVPQQKEEQQEEQ